MSRAGLGSALSLSGVGAAGKLLAIAKTMLIASIFGASAALDAFWVGYALPTVLPALLTTVVTVAFVPRFVAGLDGREGPQAWRGANSLFTLILILSMLATVALWVYAEALVRGLAPGLDAATRELAVAQTRILLPSVPLLTVSALLSALSYARERFILPAMEGVLTNLTVIAAALALAPVLGIKALALGVLAGFVLQGAVLLVGNRDLLRSSLRPAFAWGHPDFRAPLAHLFPLLVGSAGSVATALINQYFLSLGGEGAISAMAYAAMFAYLPVEIFAQSVITTFYPTLGRHLARGELVQAASRYLEGLRLVLFLTLPCGVLLALFAEPLMVLLLERGEFVAEDTRLTASITIALTLGMVFRGVAYFNYRVLHAALRPWLQVSIGLAGVATHVLLCLAWIEPHGAVGVALAASLSMLQSAALSSLFAARLVALRASGEALKGLAALLGLALLLFALGWPLSRLLWPAQDEPRRLAALFALGAGAAAGISVLLVAMAAGQQDLAWLKRRWLGRRK